jgi:hypothetical protein
VKWPAKVSKRKQKALHLRGFFVTDATNDDLFGGVAVRNA